METKTKKSTPIKEMFITYLAVSKVLYWVDTIANPGYGWQDMVNAFFMRMLERDFALIMVVILFYFIEGYVMKKVRGSNTAKIVLIHGICYVSLIGLTYLYLWILSFFFSIEYPLLREMVGFTLFGYVAAAVFLEIKDRFKKNEIKSYMSNDKLGMLEALRDEGILTQEEFEEKAAKLEKPFTKRTT